MKAGCSAGASGPWLLGRKRVRETKAGIFLGRHIFFTLVNAQEICHSLWIFTGKISLIPSIYLHTGLAENHLLSPCELPVRQAGMTTTNTKAGNSVDSSTGLGRVSLNGDRFWETCPWVISSQCALPQTEMPATALVISPYGTIVACAVCINQKSLCVALLSKSNFSSWMKLAIKTKSQFRVCI